MDGEGEIPALDSGLAQLQRIVTAGGPAVARNHALAGLEDGGWVLALDGDDILDVPGLVALLTDHRLADVEWAAGNRVLLGGKRTPHWHDRVRRWEPGSWLNSGRILSLFIRTH